MLVLDCPRCADKGDGYITCSRCHGRRWLYIIRGLPRDEPMAGFYYTELEVENA